MKKLFCFIFLCLAALPLSAQRQRISILPDEWAGRNRFAWEYDAHFQYIFDNGEFDATDHACIPSGTLHIAVLAPTVGFSVQQSRRVHHRLTAGVELAHDMGSQTWQNLAREPLLFYDVHVQTRQGVFEGLAGMFPRRYLEGAYSDAFYTGMFRNTDRNLEGVLLKWRSSRLYAELGLDWMGQYGETRRERFQIMSAGRWAATDWLALGWTGSFYHYACSVVAPNVVDNHLLEPWLKMDFSRRTDWQELSLQVGLLSSYQRDRARDAQPFLPVGGEVKAVVRRWGVALQNTTYFGDNLLPYYHEPDPSGVAYGGNLYFGARCYEGFHDIAELVWIPQLTHYLSCRVAARLHFDSGGFLGWQQQFSLQFNLDALRHRDTASGRCL